jgi:hypothetical protein
MPGTSDRFDRLMAALYRQLEDYETEASVFDVEAGLARLRAALDRMAKDPDYFDRISELARDPGDPQ